jgi:hypothetical protein
MITVSITIDEHSKYSIELKDEYKPEDFIKIFERHINKIRNLLYVSSTGERKTEREYGEDRDKVFNSNKLFRELNLKVESLGKDIYKIDHKTMRSFKFNRKIDGTDGLVWLAPRGKSLVVYFRKGDHKSVDRDNKIVRTGTFGNYPMMVIRDPKDIDYAFTIIKKIYQ